MSEKESRIPFERLQDHQVKLSLLVVDDEKEKLVVAESENQSGYKELHQKAVLVEPTSFFYSVKLLVDSVRN